MVRETRYLYVGNLPKNITEANILEHFSNYGKIQSVRMVPPIDDRPNAIIAFMDIKCASKAHSETIIIEGENIVTAYNESSNVVTLTVPIQQTNVVNQEPEKLILDNINDEKQENKNQERIILENEVNDNIKLLNQGVKVKTSSLLSKYNNFKALKKNRINDSISKRSDKKMASIIQVPEQNTLSSGESTGVDPNDNRPLGMLMKGFPTRSTDTSIRDGLFHEYKKFGKVMGVQVIGQGEERHAIVCFKKAEDASKALESSYDKKFFGTKVQVFPHEGYGNQVKKLLDEHDELHHKATRTLFVGNLDKLTTKEFLLNYFEKYGLIIDIDVKNQGQTSVYAFIQYDNIKSVVKALHELDDEYINECKVKVGFGKSLPTTCLWLGGIPESVSEKWLAIQHLINFGHLLALYIDRVSGRGLAYFETVEQAMAAVQEMKTRIVLDRKLEVDFASRDCQNLLLDAMERSGQLRPGDRPEERLSRPSSYSLIHPVDLRPSRQNFDGIHPRNRFFAGHEFGPRINFRPNLFHGQSRSYYKKVESYEPVYDHREMPVLPKYYEPPARAVDDSYENYPAYTRNSYSKERGHSLSPEKSSYNILSHHNIGADSPRSSGRYQSPIRSSKVSIDRDERHNCDGKHRRTPKRRTQDNTSGPESDQKYKKSRVSHSSKNNSISSRRRSSLDNHIDRSDKSHNIPRSSDLDRRYIEVSDRSISEGDYENDEPENDEVLDLEKKKRQLLEMLQAMEEDALPTTEAAASYEADNISTGSDVEIVEKPDILIKKEPKKEVTDRLQQKIDFLLEDNLKGQACESHSKHSSPYKKLSNSKSIKYQLDDHHNEKATKKILLKERHYRKRQFSHSSSEGSLNRLEAYSPTLSANSEEMLLPFLKREEILPNLQQDEYIKFIPCSPNNEMLIDPRPPPMTIILDEFMNLPLPDYAFDLQAMRRRVKEHNKSEENYEDYAINLLDVAIPKINTPIVEVHKNLKMPEEINPAQIDEEIRELFNDSSTDANITIKTSIVDNSQIMNDLLNTKKTKLENEPDNDINKKILEKSNFMLNKSKKDESFNKLDNLSLEERIKALDEKLNMIQHGSSRISTNLSSHSTILVSDSINQANTSSSVLDYREKYRRHRRDPTTSTSIIMDQKVAEPSDLAKTLLSRSSVFDQDTKRLEMLNKLKQESTNMSLDDIHRSNVDYSSIRNMFPLSIATSWSSTLNNIGQPLSPAPTANLYPTVTPGGVIWNTLPATIIPSPIPQQKPFSNLEIGKYPYLQTPNLTGQNTIVNPLSNAVQILDPRKLARSMNNSEFGSTSTRKASDNTMMSPLPQNNVPTISTSYSTHASVDSYKPENIPQKSKEVTSPLVSILKKQTSREEASSLSINISAINVSTISHNITKPNLELMQSSENSKKHSDLITSISDKSLKSSANLSSKINILPPKFIEESPNKKDNLIENKSKVSQKIVNNKAVEKLFEKNMSQSMNKIRQPGKQEVVAKVNEEINSNEKNKKKEVKDSTISNDYQGQNVDNISKSKVKLPKSDKNELKYKRIKMDLKDDIEALPILVNEKDLADKSFNNKVSNSSDKVKTESSNTNILNKTVTDLKQQVYKINKKSENDKVKSKNDLEIKFKSDSDMQQKNNLIKKTISSDNELRTKNDEGKSINEITKRFKGDDSSKNHKSRTESKPKIDNTKFSTSKKEVLSAKPKNKNPKESSQKLTKEIVECKVNSNKSTKKSKDSKNSKRLEDSKNEERQRELKMIAEALGEDVSQYVSMYDMVKRRSCKDALRSIDEVKIAEKTKDSNPRLMTSLSSESDALSHISDSNNKQHKQIRTKQKLQNFSSSSIDLSSDDETQVATTKKLKKSEKIHSAKSVAKVIKDSMTTSTSSSEDDDFILKSRQNQPQGKKNKKCQSLQTSQQRAKIYTSSSSEEHPQGEAEASNSSTQVKNKNKNSQSTGKKSDKSCSKSASKNVLNVKKENVSNFLSEESLDCDISESEIKSKSKENLKSSKSLKNFAPERSNKQEKTIVTKTKPEEVKDILKSVPIVDLSNSALKKTANKKFSKNESTSSDSKSKKSLEPKKSFLESCVLDKMKSNIPKLDSEIRNIFEKMDFKNDMKSPPKNSKLDINDTAKIDDQVNENSPKKDTKEIKESESDKLERWKNESSKPETTVEAVRAIIDWDQRNRLQANELEEQTSSVPRTDDGMEFDESDGGVVDELNLAIRNLIGGDEEDSGKTTTEIVETEIVTDETIAVDAELLDDGYIIGNSYLDFQDSSNLSNEIQPLDTISAEVASEIGALPDVDMSNMTEMDSITPPFVKSEIIKTEISDIKENPELINIDMKIQPLVEKQTVNVEKMDSNLYSPHRMEDMSGMEALCRAAAAEAIAVETKAAALLQPKSTIADENFMSTNRKREMEEDSSLTSSLIKKCKVSNEPIDSSKEKNEPNSSNDQVKIEITTQATWQINMDKIIDEVAKGNFERGHEFDYYSQKRQGRSRSGKVDSPTILSPSILQHQNVSTSVQQHVAHEIDIRGNMPIEIRSPIQIPQSLALINQHGFVQVSVANASSFQQMYSAGMAAARQLVAAQQQQQLVVISPEIIGKQNLRHSGISAIAMQQLNKNIPQQFISTSNVGLLTTTISNNMTNVSQPSVMIRVGQQLQQQQQLHQQLHLQPQISPSRVPSSMPLLHQQIHHSQEINARRNEETNSIENQRNQIINMQSVCDANRVNLLSHMQFDPRFQIRSQQHFYDPQHSQFIAPDQRHIRPITMMHHPSQSPIQSNISPQQHINIPSSESGHESTRQITSQKERQQAHVRPIQLTCSLPSPNIVGQHRMPFAFLPEARSAITTPRAEPKSQVNVIGSQAEHSIASVMATTGLFTPCIIDTKHGTSAPCISVFAYGSQQPVAVPQFELLMAAATNNKLISPVGINNDQQRRAVTPGPMVTRSPINRPSPEHPDRGLANLLQKLPVVWQGQLALKNDCAHVQMHFVAGSKKLVTASLPDNNAPLRIAQRMRLEATQLEQVSKRMMNELEYTMLLAVPIARDTVEMVTQNHNLQTFFIQYLQQKQAAGIVNIFQPNSTQAAYVVHIFPPCDFSRQNLNKIPQDVAHCLKDGGFLMVVITTC